MGSLHAAITRLNCTAERSTNASMNGLAAKRGLWLKWDSRTMVTRVVRMGPPSLCTMFSVVVAIGSSAFATDEYAADIEGILIAPRPHPRTKRRRIKGTMETP